jgi:hypothetical protein
VSVVQADLIRLDTIVVQGPVSGDMALWQIECECAHKSCGMSHAIYTNSFADERPNDVTRFLFDANPSVACTWEHQMEFSREKMKAERLDF